MIVDMLFSVLNFAVLAGIFAYIFFRSIVPQISEQINARRKNREDLSTQKSGCNQRLGVVEKMREQHEDEYRLIARKVVQWQRAVAEREQEFAKERQVYAEAARVRAERQAAAFLMQRRRAQIVPQALANARLELYDHFQESAAGKNYIDRVVSGIKRHHGDR